MPVKFSDIPYETLRVLSGVELVEACKELRFKWLGIKLRFEWKNNPNIRILIDGVRHEGARHASLMLSMEDIYFKDNRALDFHEENNIRSAMEAIQLYIRMCEYILYMEND